jgi:mandelate racemase
MFSKLTINSIAARAVLVPMSRSLRTASGDVPAAPLVLVDVQTNEGIVGRSYAFAYTPLMLRALVQFLSDVAPELVGETVSPRERMRQLDKQLKLMGCQGVAGMAIGALDQALWDALGHAANLPVAVLLGGEMEPLDAYDSYGLVDIKTDLALIEASVESGFEAIKIKLGAGEVADDVATVAAVRKLIGPKRRLMVDLNQSQTTASAIDLILRLKEFDLTWVEEVLESGLFDPDSVDIAGHRCVGVPARRSVLGRRVVAQRRVAVSVIVFLLEVADDHTGLEQTVPVATSRKASFSSSASANSRFNREFCSRSSLSSLAASVSMPP